MIVFQRIFINYQLIIFLISMSRTLTGRFGNILPVASLL